MQGQLSVNSVFIMLMGLAAIAGLGFAWYFIKKKNPDMTSGDLINLLLLREKMTIFVFAMILVNIAEAIFAASIAPVGELPPNPLARMLIHATVAVSGIVCNLYFPSLMVVASEEKDKKRKRDLWLTVLFLLGGSFFFPVMNLTIIAKGLGEVDKLAWMWRIWSPYGGFAAFKQMSYAMAASVSAMFAHFFLAFLDAWFIRISPHKSMMDAARKSVGIVVDSNKSGQTKKGSPTDDKINERAEKKDEESLKAFPDAIKYALSRYGYSGNDLDKKIKEATTKFDSILDAKKKSEVATSFSRLVTDISTWDAGPKQTASEEDKLKKNEEFKQRIYTLFAGKQSSGQGLGINLKQRKKGN